MALNAMRRLLRQSAKHLYEYLPDIVDGGQFYPFAGGVGLDDARTDRDDLYALELLYEISHLHDEVHLYQTRTET